MKQHFNNLRATREKMLLMADAMPLHLLNQVPLGFSNNIFWNLAHVTVTQQLLVYRLAGNDGHLDQDFIDTFRKGTKVERVYNEADLAIVIDNLISLVDKVEADYSNRAFNEYKTYETSYGITLYSVEDAIVFNNMHEALHLGYVMALRKCVK